MFNRRDTIKQVEMKAEVGAATGQDTLVQPVAAIVVSRTCTGSAPWWPLMIPGRIWFVACVLSAPFRVLALVMEMALTALVLGMAGCVWAWWTHRITDDDVAGVVGMAGERILSILSKAGIM